MTNNNYVAIMAGGVGSRFWPASRTSKPKQFLDILGVGKSLLRLTFERFLAVCPAENILIVTNELYKDLVLEHLPELKPNQILCEPSRNNTAPSVAYTAFRLKSMNPDANFVIAPSDHVILNEPEFVRIIKKALDFTAKNDALLTLGIEPTRPDTGYGYINFDQKNVTDNIFKVKKFTEKPNRQTAQQFIDSNEYLWNAGIFVWSADSILSSLQKNAPEVYAILEKGISDYNTDREAAFIEINYPKTPNISIDYAVAERADNIYTIPSQFGWSDLGTWGSLHAEATQDDAQNVVQGDSVILQNVSDCLVRVPKHKLVVLRDLHDYIVVDEDDVLLIFPKSSEQEIKKVTQDIEKTLGSGFL